MMILNNEVLNVLERSNNIACLCTTNKKGLPSGRWVKVVPSFDLFKLYVGDLKLNRAEDDLAQNSHVMFLICDRFDDPLKAKAYQIECNLENKRIRSEDDPIYKKVTENTKDELARPEVSFITNLLTKTNTEGNKKILQNYLHVAKQLETKLLKQILIFDIQNIFDCSLSRNDKESA